MSWATGTAQHASEIQDLGIAVTELEASCQGLSHIRPSKKETTVGWPLSWGTAPGAHSPPI